MFAAEAAGGGRETARLSTKNAKSTKKQPSILSPGAAPPRRLFVLLVLFVDKSSSPGFLLLIYLCVLCGEISRRFLFPAARGRD
jgi:hypothetical protein